MKNPPFLASLSLPVALVGLQGCTAVVDSKDGLVDKISQVLNLTSLVSSSKSDGTALYLDQDLSSDRRLYGYRNKQGVIVIPFQFEDATDFHEGIAAVSIGGRWGFIDKEGKFIANPIFDDVNGRLNLNSPVISEGFAAVKKEGKWGFINLSGEMVIKPQFDKATFFSEGLAAVQIGELWGFINTEGRFVINPQYEMESWVYESGYLAFHEGVAPVPQGKKWGYIDKKGDFVIKPQYDEAFRFAGGLAAVKLGEKMGYINTNGEMLIKPQFSIAFDFSEDMAAVTLSKDSAVQTSGLMHGNKNTGYINRKGELIISPIFKSFTGAGRIGGELSNFSEGRAMVGTPEGRVGYIDKTGKFVVPPKFFMGLPFRNGLANVRTWEDSTHTFTGFIDRSGKVIWDRPSSQ